MLRGEQDWRWYTGQFRAVPGELAGLGKCWVQWTTRKLPEPSDLSAPPDPSVSGRVVFEGPADHFRQLNPHHKLIRELLLGTVARRWRSVSAGEAPAPVAIHIRRGDFVKAGMQTPLEWFSRTLHLVRSRLGENVPAFVLSDGKATELADVLSIPKVVLADSGAAIGDIFRMSRAKVLIGSGGSTFSLWAAYLGQLPAVFPPGHPPSWYKLECASGRFLGTLDPERPDEQFLRDVDSAFGRV
jgi:hypothetical protein